MKNWVVSLSFSGLLSNGMSVPEAWSGVLANGMSMLSSEAAAGSCLKFGAKGIPKDMDALLNKSFPFQLKVKGLPTGEAFKRMLPDMALSTLAFAKNRSYRIPVPDDASPIGFRRVDSFNVNLVWAAVREIIDFMALRSRNPGLEVPKNLVHQLTMKYPDGQVFGGESIDLVTLLRNPHQGVYADGIKSKELQDIAARGPLSSLSKYLMKQVRNYYGRKSAYDAQVWFSGGGTEMALHIDVRDNWHCQIAGKKRITLFDPSDSDMLYPIQFNTTDEGIYTKLFLRRSGKLVEVGVPFSERDPKIHAAVDHKNPDLARFPRFAEARPVHCELTPGYCIWIPRGWWHHVEAESGHLNAGVNYWLHEGDLEKNPKNARAWSEMLRAVDRSMKRFRKLHDDRGSIHKAESSETKSTTGSSRKGGEL